MYVIRAKRLFDGVLHYNIAGRLKNRPSCSPYNSNNEGSPIEPD